MNLATLTCQLPGCDGPRSGVCINGLSFEECPDVISVEQSTSNDIAIPVENESHPIREMIDTGGARSLNASSCDALLRQRGATVVGVVAGPEVGKTTMIGTIYELIHRGRMATMGFAGSETLRGYEERCYRARISSNGVKPDTPRTRTSEQLSFTHLRVATAAGMRDILFSDRSGEHFDNVLQKPAEIRNFAELSRANAILLLVDLQQLLTSPHQPTSQTRRLFMAMQQNELLVGKPLVLVGTKSDLLRSVRDSENARATFDELKSELSHRANGKVHLEGTLVASRAPRGTSQIGSGLEALVGNLLQQNSPRKFRLTQILPERPTELDLLMRGLRSNR